MDADKQAELAALRFQREQMLEELDALNAQIGELEPTKVTLSFDCTVDDVFDAISKTYIDPLSNNQSPEDYCCALGKQFIYGNQLHGGLYAVHLMLGGIEGGIDKAAPLLIAQPQQGKTGTCLAAIYTLYVAWREGSVDTGVGGMEVIYINNIADRDLLDQTQSAVQYAGFPIPVKVIHHAQLKKLTPSPNVGIRFIIVDECHYALGRNKPFHDFMRRCGVEYGKPVSEWKAETPTYVLSVSATPYAHAIKSLLDDGTFAPVVLDLTDGYYSLQNLFADRRLRQADPITRRASMGFGEGSDIVPTEFFKERVSDFLGFCKKDGNGYLIVRTRGAAVDVVTDYVKSAGLEIWSYDCMRGNIKELDGHLSKQPPKPTLVIIRGSLRAGKTLTTTEHIRMWIDSPSSKADAMTQVVGRMLGYDQSRHQNKFPIYCNVAEIDDAIEFYNTYYEKSRNLVIPRGNWSSRLLTQERYRQYIARDYYEIPEDIRNSTRTQRISTSKSQDLAHDVLQGARRSKHSAIVRIDGPNGNHVESWRKLMALHPEWLGCFAYYVADGQADETLLRKDGMFRELPPPLD